MLIKRIKEHLPLFTQLL